MSAPGAIERASLHTWPLPPLGKDSDKEDRGRLLVVAGGAQNAGAARLVGEAGLRVGAGKLQMAAPTEIAVPLALAMPEARVIAVAARDGEIAPAAAADIEAELCRADAVVVGPGMMDEDAAGQLAARLMTQAGQAAFVLDAAALVGLGEGRTAARAMEGRLVVTPHAGEMAALSGRRKDDVQDDPLVAARELAAAWRAVVVQKGAESFVVSPDGRAWAHRAALPGLGVSGSGDVLAGAIGGLLARGASPVAAAARGVWLHARAGALAARRIAPLGFLARELLPELARALAESDPTATRAPEEAQPTR